MMALEYFDDRLEYGQEGEQQVAKELLKRNIHVIPFYHLKKTKNPPLVFYQDISFVAPDIVAFKNNKPIFVECKKKHQWTHWDNQIETGLDYKYYKSYLTLQKLSGINVFIFFVHELQSPIGIYYCSINTKVRCWDGSNAGMPSMRFFNIKDLTKLN